MSNALFPIKDYLEKCLKTPVYINTKEDYLRVIYNRFPVCKILQQKRGGYSIEFAREFIFPNHPNITWKTTLYDVETCVNSRIRYYNEKKGQKNMTLLKDLRDYLCKEIGNIVEVIYEEATGLCDERIRIKYNNCWVCSIFNHYGSNNLFDVVFFDPFICRWAGYASGVNLTSSEIPKAIKNRINICENNNRIDININADDNTVPKSIYMMTARGSGKTRWILDLLKELNLNIKHNIKDVIFNDPATIVFWVDGSKTVVKCQPGETFDPEKGLAMAISKKVLGNDYGYYETFAKYVGRYNKQKSKKVLKEANESVPTEITHGV